MSMETDVFLRSILYQLLTADSLEDAIRAVKVMCSKDVYAAVKEEADAFNAKKEKKHDDH